MAQHIFEIRRFEPKSRVFGSAKHIQVRKDIFPVFFLLFFGQFGTYCLMYRLNRGYEYLAEAQLKAELGL